MYQDIEYNDLRGSSLKIFVKERPDIPAASLRTEEIKIPGRDGILLKTDGSFEPTDIKIKFNYIGEESRWGERWRTAQKWLSARNSKLFFSDDESVFFKISHVELDENERTSRRVGNFNAVFKTLDGLHYLRAGELEYSINDVKWNAHELAHPTYKIIGEGNCTLVVNGNEMKANITQNLTIDTDRMIAYRNDGVIKNTSVTGYYDNLYLISGENKIEISKGFELKVIPNWRCR